MQEDRKTRRVLVGGVPIGGASPVSVQSMLNVPAADIARNVRQALELEQAGCQILRVAVPDREAVRLVPAIKEKLSIPLVADIHFDYRLALECAAAGVDKIRLNPGNIGEDSRVKHVADACRTRSIPIRIGVNSGSVEKEILAKHGGPTVDALVESAEYHIRLLERFDFEDIVVSVKASDVRKTISAYRKLASRVTYPLHLGVTEAGTERMGLVKSSIGIGSLLADGIGDTIRVSLTADPVREIAAAKDILQALGLGGKGIRFTSCPTCGRTKIDLIGLVNRVEAALAGCDKDISVAIMGCVVNGPGEAREADIGIAGGDGEALLFQKGQPLRKVPEAPFAGMVPQRMPRWLRQPLVHAYGREVVSAIEAVQAGVPPLDLTLRAGAVAPEGEMLPTGSLRLEEKGQVSALAGYEAGGWWVQDAAAALAVRLLAPVAGERLLDLCCAPGGKTLQLAASGAQVVAVDLSGARMGRVRIWRAGDEDGARDGAATQGPPGGGRIRAARGAGL